MRCRRNLQNILNHSCLTFYYFFSHTNVSVDRVDRPNKLITVILVQDIFLIKLGLRTIIEPYYIGPNYYWSIWSRLQFGLLLFCLYRPNYKLLIKLCRTEF